ncbi:MAG: WecB/TagA/CpsF family glycosyltransferase [Candidatus Riflebacteria bacterium]|nr:WecB/TagA/CpsF family glycosyltransferase [Candidatus Riflebacteria bacterium]
MSDSPASSPRSPPRVNVLGVGVHAVDMPGAVDLILTAARQGRPGYVCATSVHGIVEAQRDPSLRRILNRAMLNSPDGRPLVWVGRLQGFRDMDQVSGPELMHGVCRESVRWGLRHFLFGGEPGVAARLQAVLEEAFPGIQVVGTATPPFRPLEPPELAELATRVRESRPDLFWVGTSTPKQERFMADHHEQLGTTLMLGVGGAFDVLTGRVKNSPLWLKRCGLRWAHRILQDPVRLAPRYLRIVPIFTFLIALELLG